MAETTTKRGRGRPKKAKQQWIEGTAPGGIPELDAAAEAYIEVRDERAALSIQEKEAQENLKSRLKDHGLNRYEYEDSNGDIKIIDALDSTKVIVKKKDKPKASNGEE